LLAPRRRQAGHVRAQRPAPPPSPPAQVALGVAAGPAGGYTQLDLTGGTVALGGTLNADFTGFTPTVGQQFEIIANQGGSAVTGTFSGLAEGAKVTTVGGVDVFITYQGGNGHDVVLFTKSYGSPGPGLGPNWTMAPNPYGPPGSFSVNAGNQAVAGGTNFNTALVNGFTPADVSVSALVDLAGATGAVEAGVVARRDASNNGYVGLIYHSGSFKFALLGIARGAGNLTLIHGTTPKPITTLSGTLRLDVFGSTLKLYLDGILLISATDTTLTVGGGVGLHSAISPGATFGNFSAYALSGPALPFSDNFTRPPAKALGNPWSVDQGGFTLANDQAVAAALIQSEATLYGTSLTTVDESATIANPGTSGAGLLARWNSAMQTGYEAIWTGTQVQLFAVVNGVANQIGTSAPATGSSGTLRLIVSGNTQQVFFNGTLLITGNDSTIGGPGLVGLISLGGSSAFGLYTVNGS
jgi:hypothetical protein